MKKNIVFVGGTGSLSLSIVQSLIKLNTKIAILDLPSLKLNRLDKFKNVKTIETDISNELKFKKSFLDAKRYLKRIDVVVNCASITSEFFKKSDNYFNEFHNYDMDTWNKSISVNLSGVFLSCRESIKVMIKQKYGKIINFSSLYGFVSPNYNLYKDEKFNTPASYSASKSGVIGLSKWIAVNYARYGISVNIVSPGGVYNNQSNSFVKKYSNLNPSNRMANKNDLNSLLEFLIFENNSYINGHNFIVDGGFSVW